MTASTSFRWRAGQAGADEGEAHSLPELLQAFLRHAHTGRFIASNERGRLVLHFDANPIGKAAPVGEAHFPVPVVRAVARAKP